MKHASFLLVPLLLLFAAFGPTHAQSKYMTKTGKVTFFSATPIEDIEASTQQVAAVLNIDTGQLAFSLPMKSFVFKRTLMQEHFNENYVESDKFPRATFAGRFVGLETATLAAAGPHAAKSRATLRSTVSPATFRCRPLWS